jgi:hypothetical protein
MVKNAHRTGVQSSLYVQQIRIAYTAGTLRDTLDVELGDVHNQP